MNGDIGLGDRGLWMGDVALRCGYGDLSSGDCRSIVGDSGGLLLRNDGCGERELFLIDLDDMKDS